MELHSPAITFTTALAAGIVAQALARHLRVPGIVLLLLAGAILGPDVLGIVRPGSLGYGLDIIVGLSVAIILFEGGLNLNIDRLRHEADVIRRLVTTGALVTAIGGAVVARMLMGWPWPVAALFGALVIVTGPTVITPLLRRVRVSRNVATILEAEGVFIDPIGAIVAVVALEVVLTSTTGDAALGLLGLPSRLILGTVAGLVGGMIIAVLLRYENVVPEGLENIFTLSLVLILFEVSDAIQEESGILAATVAGLVVGNVGTRVSAELRGFKEQLTVLLVGLLFVLLAADVRLAEVQELGWAGVGTVLLLMLVVRPLDVAVSTWRSDLDLKERTFIGWLGPRGIVAAAVASIVAERFLAVGFDVGSDFRALVFLVIALTVVVQGLSIGPVASWLGVRRPTDRGYAIVGANPLGRVLAHALHAPDNDEEVVLIDSNSTEAREAEAEGLTVIYGNANDEDVLRAADVEGRRGFVAATTNEGANLVLAQRAKTEFRVPTSYAALERKKEGIAPERAREARTKLLFGRPSDLDHWIHVLRVREAMIESWRFEGEQIPLAETPVAATPDRILPLVHLRGAVAVPVSETTVLEAGDRVVLASFGPSSVRLVDTLEWSQVSSILVAPRR